MDENGENPDKTFYVLNEKLFAIKRYENAIEDYNRIWAKEEKDKLNLSNYKKIEIENAKINDSGNFINRELRRNLYFYTWKYQDKFLESEYFGRNQEYLLL